MCEICSMTATFDPGRHPGQGPFEATVFEGGDAPGSTATPYAVSIGDTFEGTLTASSDTSDVIAVTLTAGTTYEITHSGSAGSGGTLSDPYLRLLDSGGAQIAASDDGGTGLDSQITFTATTTGTYYIEAGSYASSGSGSYTVAVNAAQPSEAGTLDELANFLTHGYWGGSSRSWNTSSDNVISVNISALTSEGQQLARWAFEAWEMVANIRFVETTGSANMTFDDNQSGAFASWSSSGGSIISANVNVSTSWINAYGTTIDSYSFQTYVHEVGHALGLGHQGAYNGSASYGNDETFANDSWQMSLMSYFSQTENTSINASYAFTLGPMMADIVAIQNLYGAPSAGAAIDTIGNTTWGANSNLGGYLGAYFDTLDGPNNPGLVGNRNVTFTIYDHSGTDTLDTTFTNTNNLIDMRDQQFSNVDGLIGNIGIARGTVLENVIAGRGNDTIIGNNADNRISGGAGNDTVNGGNGTDTVVINATQANSTITDLGNGRVQIVSSDGTDSIEGVEFFEFNDQTISLDNLFDAPGGGDDPVVSPDPPVIPDPPAVAPSPPVAVGAPVTDQLSGLEYIASYSDLSSAFGTNASAGMAHYDNTGRFEGRAVFFDSLEYIATYDDLMSAFGVNATAGVGHYINQGRFEGRAIAFDSLEYIASYGDLIGAFGANADAGAQHFISAGRFEGRVRDSFDAQQYLDNYADLDAAFGSDLNAAVQHYIEHGFAEGRTDDFLFA